MELSDRQIAASGGYGVSEKAAHSNNDLIVDKAISNEESAMASDTEDMNWVCECPIDKVFWNDLIMENIISHIPQVQDRARVELACSRLRELSQRSFYFENCINNSILDLFFENVAALLTVAVAGNAYDVHVLVSADRIQITSPERDHQPETSIEIIEAVCQRFVKQIRHIRIGGITDLERRLGYIADHQLVLTRDLVEAFEKCRNVTSLSIRNCCLTSSVIDFWCDETSKLIRKLNSVCIHNMWFDRTDDSLRFARMFSYDLRRISLSDCGLRTVTSIVTRLRAIGVILDTAFMTVDFRTFRSVNEAQTLFEQLASVTKEIHVCICITNFIDSPGSHVLFKALPLFSSDFKNITSIELDLGYIRRPNHHFYDEFFCGLVRLNGLRNLRLSGHSIVFATLPVWESMVSAIGDLRSLTELAIHGLARSLKANHLDMLFNVLPEKLKLFVFGRADNFTDDHLQALIERCPNLETLYLHQVRMIGSASFLRLLTELKKLKCIASYLSGQVYKPLFDKLIDRAAIRNVQAIIIASSREPFTNEQLEKLRNRYQMVIWNTGGDQYRRQGWEYRMWATQESYEQLQSAFLFANCPECEKDLSLIDDDEFY